MTAKITYVSTGALGLAALALTGCSSGTSSTTSPTPAPTTVTAGSAINPPAGAKELEATTTNGVSYSRYSISGTGPEQVVGDYSSGAQAAGYTVTNTGSGGGGWGGYGGASAGMSATGSGTYLNVQAGGATSGPTYFEVCSGANASAVDQCDQKSQNSQNNNSQNNNNNDSHSGGS